MRPDLKLTQAEADLVQRAHQRYENLGCLDALIEKLKSQHGLIPFVGAGLSVPFGYGTWKGFLQRFADRENIRSAIDSLLDKQDYEGAAEMLHNTMGRDPFHHAITATFKPPLRLAPRTAAARLLPVLCKGPVVTTNFDHVLETVYRDAGIPFSSRIIGIKEDALREAVQEGSHILLKLHGDAAERTERILTKSDYVREYDEIFAKFLAFIINYPILFLGCSLASDRSVVIIREAVERAGQSSFHRSFAFVEYPRDKDQCSQRKKALASLKISPIWYPPGKHEYVRFYLKEIVQRIQTSFNPPQPKITPVVNSSKTSKHVIARYCKAVLGIPLFSNLTHPSSKHHVEPSGLLEAYLNEKPHDQPIIAGRNSLNPIPLSRISNDIANGPAKVTILLGEAGVGKTTTCNWLAHKFAANWQHLALIPVLTPLAQWNPAEPFERFLDRQVRTVSFNHLRRVVRESGTLRLVLLLDGWNEREDTDDLKRVQEFITGLIDRDGARAVITTRPIIADDLVWLPQLTKLLEIQRWSPQQLATYFNQHSQATRFADLPSNVRDSLRLPLLAFLFLKQPKGDPGQTGSSTTSNLLEHILKSLLSRDRTHEGHGTRLDGKILETILRRLALSMTQNGTLSTNASIFRKCLPSSIANRSADILAHLIEVGVLRHSEPAMSKPSEKSHFNSEFVRFSFLHQTLQEFYTAQCILSKPRRQLLHELPSNPSNDVFWSEVPCHMMNIRTTSPAWQSRFLEAFLKKKDLLTAARIFRLIADPELRGQAEGHIIEELNRAAKSRESYAHIVETYQALGDPGRQALRRIIKDTSAWTHLLPVPEARLRGLRWRSSDEIPWRRVARAIFVLGEIRDPWLAPQLTQLLPDVKSNHLLYHISESLLKYTRTQSQPELRKLLIQAADFLSSGDEVTAAYAAAMRLDLDGSQPNTHKLTCNLEAFLLAQSPPNTPAFRNAFWRRAHGARALGEIASPRSCADILLRLFDIEAKAKYPRAILGGFEEVHSSILKAVLSAQERANGDVEIWKPLISACITSERIETNKWACAHLGIFFSKYFKLPPQLDWLRQWEFSPMLGGSRIRQTISRALYTISPL